MFTICNRWDKEDVGNVQNEIAFANMFLAANNPNILSKLSEEEKNDLNEILANYTKICIKQIKYATSKDDPGYQVRPQNHRY